MKLVFATNNKHKLQEIRSLLPEGYELLSLYEIGCYSDPPETHDTMEENALQKALFIFNTYGFPCFADDSGLEVQALGGKPGVHSARYAGQEKDTAKNMDKLLREMSEIKDRKARFKTVIAYADKRETRTFEGTVHGHILEKPSGTGGFGYDPVFRPEGFQQSFAEMPMAEKNTMSHRGKAFALLIKYLNQLPGFSEQDISGS